MPAVPGCEVGPESAPNAVAGSKRKWQEPKNGEGMPGGDEGTHKSRDAGKPGLGVNADGQGAEESDAEDGEGEEDTPNQMFTLYENFRRSKGKVEKLRGTLRAGVVNLDGRDFAFGGAQSAFDWG